MTSASSRGYYNDDKCCSLCATCFVRFVVVTIVDIDRPRQTDNFNCYYFDNSVYYNQWPCLFLECCYCEEYRKCRRCGGSVDAHQSVEYDQMKYFLRDVSMFLRSFPVRRCIISSTWSVASRVCYTVTDGNLSCASKRNHLFS